MEIEGKEYDVHIAEKKQIDCQMLKLGNDDRSKKAKIIQANPDTSSPGNPMSNEESPKQKSAGTFSASDTDQEDETVSLGNSVTNPFEKLKSPLSPNNSLKALEPWEMPASHNHWNLTQQPITEPSIGLNDISSFRMSPSKKTAPSICNKPISEAQATLSPLTKIKNTNIQIILSPTKNLSLSPLPTQNKFSTLMRPNKPKSASTSTIGSSSCSGPLFPPGFEDQIPIHTKTTQIKKKKKKIGEEEKIEAQFQM